MRKIILHGSLRSRFGSCFDTYMDTPAKALHLLMCQVEGLREAIAEGGFILKRDSQYTGIEGYVVKFGNCERFHIVPAVEGLGGGKGMTFGKIALGIGLIAFSAVSMGAGALASASAFSIAGWGMTYGNILMLGIALTFAGMASLFTPQVKANYNETAEVDERPSFLYNGAINTDAQGIPVPLAYGRVKIGSVVVSAGIETVRI